MRPNIEGRNPEIAQWATSTAAGGRPYRKTASVRAVQLDQPARIVTPEGGMLASAGDYLVSDDPPTHLWPVRREVFEATYEALPEEAAS